MPPGATTLRADYYFISDEFLDFLGSEFDDNATLTVAGSSGAESVVLASVNQFVEGELTPLESFPDDSDGDGDFYRSDLQTASIEIRDLGSQITVAITITDVEDELFTSLLLFDNVRFE